MSKTADFIPQFIIFVLKLLQSKELAGNAVLPADIRHPLMHFREYLIQGYFPFAKQDDYLTRLENVINHTMEIDIPAFARMNISTSRKLKQLLEVISKSVPFKPNFSEIGRAIGEIRTDQTAAHCRGWHGGHREN